jgi:DNA-binding transcriptional LysR family regulator
MQTTLLHRTTRSLSLTESGRLSLERAARILADGAAVEAEILEEAAIPRGLIRLASTTAFGIQQLAPLLPEFMARYPEIMVDFELTDRRIDLITEGVDVVLRAGPEPDSSLRISKLFAFRVPLVASPAFFEKHGRPEHPAELAQYPALVFSHIAGSETWHFRHAVRGEVTVQVDGRMRVNNGVAAVPALVAGFGITSLPEAYVSEELADGRLEEVLKDWPVRPAPLHVVTPPGRARPARVRVLLDFLRQHFATKSWAEGIQS